MGKTRFRRWRLFQVGWRLSPARQKVLHVHFTIPSTQAAGTFFLKSLITLGIQSVNAVGQTPIVIS